MLRSNKVQFGSHRSNRPTFLFILNVAGHSITLLGNSPPNDVYVSTVILEGNITV